MFGALNIKYWSIYFTGQKWEEEDSDSAELLYHMSGFILLHENLVDSSQLDLLRLVGQGSIPVHAHLEELLLHADGKLLQVLEVVAPYLEKLRHLWDKKHI